MPYGLFAHFLLVLNKSTILHSMVSLCVPSYIHELHVLEDLLHSPTNH